MEQKNEETDRFFGFSCGYGFVRVAVVCAKAAPALKQIPTVNKRATDLIFIL